MRVGLLLLLLLPCIMLAQDAERLQRALRSGDEHALDRWMKREIHRVRKGHQVTTPSGSYTAYRDTHDSLVAFLRRQPGVLDAAWDGCMDRIDIWPGHSTIGLQWRDGAMVFERCWKVQEGIPGTIDLFGWHPRVRQRREQLKYVGARECPGFVAEQRRWCAQRGR